MLRTTIARVAMFTATLITSMSLHAALQPAAANLDKLLKPVNTFTGRFKQTVFSDRKKVIQQSSGTMEFKRPMSFRWQVEKPEASLIVTNGDKIWNYDVELEQVTIQKFSTNGDVTPISFLFDNIETLNNDFTIIEKPHKGHSNFCYLLTPKKDNASFVSVEICFKSGQIEYITILDHMNQTSKFVFDHMQKNTKISDNRFTFIAPTGVDVIGE